MSTIIDSALREHPSGEIAKACALAAYLMLYSLSPGDRLYMYDDGWDIVSMATETNTVVEYHGRTKEGDLKFRMLNSLYPYKRWETSILPGSIFEGDICDEAQRSDEE